MYNGLSYPVVGVLLSTTFSSLFAVLKYVRFLFQYSFSPFLNPVHGAMSPSDPVHVFVACVLEGIVVVGMIFSETFQVF